MQDTWTKVQFVFTPHKGSEGVFTVKLAEEDFEALEDNQVLVQVRSLSARHLSGFYLSHASTSACFFSIAANAPCLSVSITMNMMRSKRTGFRRGHAIAVSALQMQDDSCTSFPPGLQGMCTGCDAYV